MQSLKSVLSRKDEQENLKNFLFSLTVVTVLVVSFFGIQAARFLIQVSPHTDTRQIASVELESYEKVE
jgi:hypothetical protein